MILSYLDDVIFAALSARGALSAAQVIINVLRRFGWLIHPTKCVGTSAAVQVFQALGTVVNLATQTFSVPPDTVKRIVEAAEAFATGPPSVPVRSAARLKGLLAATWVSTGLAARIRTRALDAIINGRPRPAANSGSAVRRSWAALVTVSPAAREEALWWARFLPSCTGQPIRPRPFDSSVDGDIHSDASDTGSGAVIRSLPSSAASSSLVKALLAKAPRGMAAEVTAYAARGIEFMAPFPSAVVHTSSTYRELYGVATFVLAVAPLLRGGRFRLFMDNLGCVFILGGVVPEFAVGGKRWGEYVSGGSPNAELQELALQLFQSQLDEGFELQAVWLPREQDTRADYLSHVSEMRHHDYRLRPALFHQLNALWGPHTVDRFACSATRQLARFCSHYFHPDAEWVDAFSASWEGELNWLFPPATVSAIGRTVAHLCACGAEGTLIVPLAPWSPWRPLLRPQDVWAPFVTGAQRLGNPTACLYLPGRYRSLFRGCALYALRVDGRRATPLAPRPSRA